MKCVYQSHFKSYIEGLIEQKHVLGFPYKSSELYLHKFDQMCRTDYPNETTLTKEIGQKWGTIRATEKRASFQNRLAPIRELAKYMLRLGVSAYIVDPIAIPAAVKHTIPHIFTDSELTLFFRAADNIACNERGKIRHLIVPVIFRLMYCCGLRPSEVRLIKKENLDFKLKTISIPESKGHKDRMVVMSDDISSLVENFLAVTQTQFKENAYLFPNWRMKITQVSVQIELGKIPTQKSAVSAVEYLKEDALKALLAQPGSEPMNGSERGKI